MRGSDFAKISDGSSRQLQDSQSRPSLREPRRHLQLPAELSAASETLTIRAFGPCKCRTLKCERKACVRNFCRGISTSEYRSEVHSLGFRSHRVKPCLLPCSVTAQSRRPALLLAITRSMRRSCFAFRWLCERHLQVWQSVCS